MIFLLHIALSVSSPALSPVWFKSRWQSSFHLVFVHPLFIFPGMSVLNTFNSMCSSSLLITSRLHLESHSSVVLLVQPGEPLQALVFPAAEYCAPVWSRCPHVRKVDVAINSSLRTISGCLKPTPVFQLPVLAGIAPAGLRRKAATLALARKAVKHDWHILPDTTKNEVPPCRLKSRKPYNKEAQEMLSVIPEDRSKDAWIAATWKQEWEASGPTRVHRHISDPGEGVKGEDLRRKYWTTLNRLRTGVGRYKASIKKWGLADSAACECGEPEQTADHIINSCPLHRPPSEAGIFEVGPLTRAWLQQTELTIIGLCLGWKGQ